MNPVPRQQFEELVADALDEVPSELMKLLDNVVVLVEDRNEDEPDLLGLYEGVNMLDKVSGLVDGVPDVIFLYREPILDYWDEGEREESIRHIIAHVLIHEIGHHFGFSDEDMERIEESAIADED